MTHIPNGEGSTLCGFMLPPPWTEGFTVCPVCTHVLLCEDDSCCVSHDGTA